MILVLLLKLFLSLLVLLPFVLLLLFIIYLSYIVAIQYSLWKQISERIASVGKILELLHVGILFFRFAVASARHSFVGATVFRLSRLVTIFIFILLVVVAIIVVLVLVVRVVGWFVVVVVRCAVVVVLLVAGRIVLVVVVISVLILVLFGPLVVIVVELNGTRIWVWTLVWRLLLLLLWLDWHLLVVYWLATDRWRSN